MHLIHENMQKQLEWCHENAFYTLEPLTTDIATDYDHVTHGNATATVCWYCGAMLCYFTTEERQSLSKKRDIKAGVITYTLAVHANAQFGAQYGDNALSKTRFRFREENQFNLGLGSETVRESRDASFLLEGTKTAHFCSMCISREVRRYVAEKGNC